MEKVRYGIIVTGRARGLSPGVHLIEDSRPLVAVTLGRVNAHHTYDHAARRGPDPPVCWGLWISTGGR